MSPITNSPVIYLVQHEQKINLRCGVQHLPNMWYSNARSFKSITRFLLRLCYVGI